MQNEGYKDVTISTIGNDCEKISKQNDNDNVKFPNILIAQNMSCVSYMYITEDKLLDCKINKYST